MGLSPPQMLVKTNKIGWVSCQHDYTTMLLQVGDVMPVRSLPALWASATMIMLGKYKQGEVWLEGSRGLPCPEVCRNDKYWTQAGYLAPANNHFLALNKTTKHGILFGAHCCDLYLDEAGAHCFLPSRSPHQEVLSGPSLCLPSTQASYEERTRPLWRGCWHEGTTDLCRRDSWWKTARAVSTSRGTGTTWTWWSYAKTSRLSSLCSRTRIGGTSFCQHIQEPSYTTSRYRLLGWS